MNKHMVKHAEHPPTAEHRARCEALIGTCHMSDPEWMEDLTHEECLQMDAIVFSCEQCGWWCDADECNEDDGWFCNDCYKENHPEDDD